MEISPVRRRFTSINYQAASWRQEFVAVLAEQIKVNQAKQLALSVSEMSSNLLLMLSLTSETEGCSIFTISGTENVARTLRNHQVAEILFPASVPEADLVACFKMLEEMPGKIRDYRHSQITIVLRERNLAARQPSFRPQKSKNVSDEPAALTEKKRWPTLAKLREETELALRYCQQTDPPKALLNEKVRPLFEWLDRLISRNRLALEYPEIVGDAAAQEYFLKALRAMSFIKHFPA